MWIDRKSWEDIKTRLSQLERKHESLVIDVKQERTLDVLTGKKKWVNSFGSCFEMPDTRTLSLKEAVGRILDHLGIKFSYVEGVPERIDLEKVKK